ncbi:MAG: DUF4349 domain-containing protein [Acidimicrobiales bacterium]
MMIDEDLLAEAMRALGDAVEIPADGPARILEAATPAPPAGSQPKRSGLLAAAAAIVVLAAGSVFVATRSAHHSGLSSAADVSPVTHDGSTDFKVATGGGSGSSAEGGAASGVGSAAASGVGSGAAGGAATPLPAAPRTAAPAAPAVPTKVVKTGSVDLVVPKGHLTAAVNQLTSMSAGFGGLIAESKSTEGTSTPTADLTLRVPADNFEALLAKVRSIGTPTSVTASGQDVTPQSVDLKARIDSLTASRSRYLDILRHASTIPDILGVQQQIDALQTQIEQLQGQENLLENQASYSTLAVHVAEPESAARPANAGRPSGISRAWAHARHSFARGIESVLAASGGIAVFAVTVAALLVLGRLGWAVIRRRLV